ncbi:MAG: hypothetical protein E7017_06555 [Alphaproteobacteria bacterium]|nr:hypothetical protein [Alphaproteobacteria bacterium]
MSKPCITYHIVGGGLSGLACAWFLKQKNKNNRVVIYEASSILGGRTYSYFNKNLGLKLDNAVHAVVGANKFMSRFIKKDEWLKNKYFIDMQTDTLDNSIIHNSDHILKSFCNTKASDIDNRIRNNILKTLFPFTRAKTKVWFSKQDLTPRIINMLAAYADEIKLNSRLQRISSQFGMAAMLDFGSYSVDIGANDKVIIALDNLACNKILNVNRLEHSSIINITFKTSQTIFLPKGTSFIGVKNGIADWIFVDNNLLTVVISDADIKDNKLSDVAIKVWKELDAIRGVNSGFLPPYKATIFPNATIKQDIKNNALRPQTPLTEYPNVYIAGDWTMRDYPCCMETAIKSAERAVRFAQR